MAARAGAAVRTRILVNMALHPSFDRTTHKPYGCPQPVCHGAWEGASITCGNPVPRSTSDGKPNNYAHCPGCVRGEKERERRAEAEALALALALRPRRPSKWDKTSDEVAAEALAEVTSWAPSQPSNMAPSH